MDNTDCGRMQGPAGTPGSPAVLSPGPWNTRQHVQDDAIDQVYIGQAAYMQSPPLESLLPDADIPNSTEARAYTHSSSSPSATPTLPLAGSVAAQDMAEDKAATSITTAFSSPAGSVTPSALQDLLLELELQSVANHQRPSAALAEDHSGETSFVMKLPRSGLTTWKPLVASRLQDVDRMAPSSSLVKNAAPQDGSESTTNSSTASDIGASVLAHRPVPVLTSQCETAALPLNEPELMPDGDFEHSPAIYAGLAGREATDAPTSMQASSTQSPAPPDVTIPEAGAGVQQGILPDTADEGQPGDDIIIPEDLGVLRASPSDDVVLPATDQNAACPPVVQEHSMESAFESAVIPSTILEPVLSDDSVSVRQETPSEQLAPETVGCMSTEASVTGDIAASSLDTEKQASLASSEDPPSTTHPLAEEEMVEEGPDDAAIPISAAALDHISALATFTEADDDPRVDTSCDRPSSQDESVVSRSCLQEATLVDLEHEFPDSGMPCSAASIPADVPMDRDGLNLEPPPASDDSHYEALPPMTTADDAAAHLHPPEASVPTDIDTDGAPLSENANDDSKLDLVAEDSAPLQGHGEDVPRADDAIVLPTRAEETAVQDPGIVSEDLLQPEKVISSRLVDTLDDHADVPMPLDDVASAPPSQEMDMRLSEELAQPDDIGIALAGDVRGPEGGPATASLSEYVDVPCPGLSTVHISEDAQPTDAPADILDTSDAYSGANSNVCFPLESAALLSSQAGLDTDSLLDVDMADCFAALPDFGDGIPASEDFQAAMPISDDLPDDVVLLDCDLPPSSPPPSSSPPRVFSSPGPTSLETTPTSSPPLGSGNVDGPATPSPFPKGQLSGSDSRLLKRALEEEDSAAPAGTSHLPRLRERQTKRVKTEDVTPAHTPPNPTRPTPASQAKERKKLAAPFRSPVIKGPLVQGGLHAVYATGRAKVPPPPRKARAAEDDKASSSSGLPVKPEVPVANKDRTANVAKQFKSPLHASTVSCSVSDAALAMGTFSSVKAAPTIQALQGKVQTLKQAIKIKNSRNGDDEDDVLEGLVEKWTTAAREVAWGVWEYVKDLDPGCAADVGTKSGWFADDDGRAGPGTKRGLDSSWGYDDGHAGKRARLDDGADQADEKEKENEEEEEEESPVVHHTLGVMLRRMGIDPATLGWDEEEGDFVDVDA